MKNKKEHIAYIETVAAAKSLGKLLSVMGVKVAWDADEGRVIYKNGSGRTLTSAGVKRSKEFCVERAATAHALLCQNISAARKQNRPVLPGVRKARERFQEGLNEARKRTAFIPKKEFTVPSEALFADLISRDTGTKKLFVSRSIYRLPKGYPVNLQGGHMIVGVCNVAYEDDAFITLLCILAKRLKTTDYYYRFERYRGSEPIFLYKKEYVCFKKGDPIVRQRRSRPEIALKAAMTENVAGVLKKMST